MNISQNIDFIRANIFFDFLDEHQHFWDGYNEEYGAEQILDEQFEDMLQLGLEIHAGVTEDPFVDAHEDGYFVQLDW